MVLRFITRELPIVSQKSNIARMRVTEGRLGEDTLPALFRKHDPTVLATLGSKVCGVSVIRFLVHGDVNASRFLVSESLRDPCGAPSNP